MVPRLPAMDATLVLYTVLDTVRLLAIETFWLKDVSLATYKRP